MSSALRRGAIVVFAKAPRPGRVKTRMVPPFSPAQAAELYACMLADVLETTARVARSQDLEAILAVHPVSALREMAERSPACFRVIAQRGEDLAERMAWAASQAAAGACLPVLLRGSDSPLLSEYVMRGALQELEANDLVASPDADGGYSLIGLREPCSGLFDHAMSTGAVLQDTLANARAAGLSTRLLEAGTDVDTVEDLATLKLARDQGGAAANCPRTLAFLDRIGGWEFVVTGSAQL